MRIYLSGPMTGLPEFNYPAFNEAAAALRAEGYQVENPAENAKQPDWASYMRQALEQLLRCDEVLLLPGWEQSSGAVWEASIAFGLEMEIGFFDGAMHDASAVMFFEHHLVALPAPGALRKAVAA